MTDRRLHLVRHGEVYNPSHVLYGRLPGFGLSEAGRRMTVAAAEYVQRLERPVSSLICSPLQRTQESAEPFTELFGLTPVLDERVIEPTNVFEGTQMRRSLTNPANWWHLRRPSVPSWGEPYASIAERMLAAMDAAWGRFDRLSGDRVDRLSGDRVDRLSGDRVDRLSGDRFDRLSDRWGHRDRLAPGADLDHAPAGGGNSAEARPPHPAMRAVERDIVRTGGDVWREVAYAEPAAAGIDLGAV